MKDNRIKARIEDKSGQAERVITRRDFLKGSAGAALAVAMGLRLYSDAEGSVSPYQSSGRKSIVVLVRDEYAVDRRGRINLGIVDEMMDRAVSRLLSRDNHKEAWRLLIKPKDIVGIKSNIWGPLPTTEKIEQAIKSRIMDAGVSENNIGIDDRGVLKNRIFLNSTALINVRPLRAHHWSGIGGCIKNYVMFTRHPWLYHPRACANLGAIWNYPIVKNKTRLNILLLLTPQFHVLGAHHFDPKYTWQYKGILVGTDPVALDAVGLRIFMAKRAAFFGREVPLRPPAIHVALADTRHNIGVSDLSRIEIIRLGWMEDAMI